MTTSRPYSFLNALVCSVAVLWLAVLSPSNAGAGHSPCLALHDAAFMDEPEIVRDLLNAGVDVECKNQDGHTPLITALEGASEDTIRLLLAYGANANALNAYGETPLQRAREQFARFDAEKPERYALLFMNVIDQLEQAGGFDRAVMTRLPISSP